jgi:transcriptional regulator with XRE-family HTH domain
MSFAENLKYLRKQRKMTQKELGKALDVALSTVGMWETGGRQPDLDTTVQVARFFDVSVSDLIGEDAYAHPIEKSSSGNWRGSMMNDELAQLRDMLRTRPEMKMLFSVSKNASKEDIERAVAIIEALKEQSR